MNFAVDREGAEEERGIESGEDASRISNQVKGVCHIQTMLVFASLMSFFVLLVGLIGFLPMYLVGFDAALDATRLVHKQAINYLFAVSNYSVFQLPKIINVLYSNYIPSMDSNTSFLPEDKGKLLFAMANVLSIERFRDQVSYLVVTEVTSPNTTWGVVAAADKKHHIIGGSVLHNLLPKPLYKIDTENMTYVFPYERLAPQNLSLGPIVFSDDGPYKTIVLPWNDHRKLGLQWNRRWFPEGVYFTGMYFNYVLPFKIGDRLGFFQAATWTSAIDKGMMGLIERSPCKSERFMLLDSNTGIVVMNNWGQQLTQKVENESKRRIEPLMMDGINDLLMQETVHEVNIRGGFIKILRGKHAHQFSYVYHKTVAHVCILRLKDEFGLDITACITTLEADFFYRLFLARTFVAVATGVSVAIVAGLAALLAYFIVKPLLGLLPDLQRASNLQLRNENGDKGGNNRGFSYIAEIQDVQNSYTELTRQLRILKTFVPEAILAAPTGNSGDGKSVFTRKLSTFQIHSFFGPNDSITNASTEFEMTDQKGFAKSRQEMQLNRRVFKEQPNTFTRRYCTVVLIENTQPSSLDAYFNNILNFAAGQNGCVEYLRPDRTLVSFGAHLPLPMHSIKGCRFAFELFAKLTLQEKKTVTILVDSSEFLVGTCSAHFRNARVVVGIVRLRELLNVARRLECHLAATAGTVSQLQDYLAFPVECVLLSSSPVPVVLSELRPPISLLPLSAVKMSKRFRLGFAAMRQGDYKQAMSHYHKIGKSDPQARRLLRLCEQRCEAGDVTPYIRFARHAYNIHKSVINDSYKSPDEGTPEKEILREKETAFNLGDKASEALVADSSVALFEMYQNSSSETFDACMDAYSGADDMPLFLTDMNQKVWTRSLNRISEGAFSTVYLGMSEDGVQVAIKCIPRRRRDIMQESLEAEMNVASKLRHPNIVQYVSCSVVQSYLAIIMEYVPGGSLHTVIKKFGKVSPLVARRFTVDILNGLNYLHGIGIVHCDVKPHNVLLGMDGVCKLSDFGSTISEAADMARTMVDEVMLRGTALYMAPEVARGGRCTPQSDIFSLGISLLEMLFGRLPWRWSSKAPEGSDTASLHALFNRDSLFVQSLARGHLEPEIPDSLDNEVACFVRSCCHLDPAMRPSALGLLSYAFVL